MWFLLQAIDHIINSAAKSNYMSSGQISVPIVFRGPNGAAAGVGAQHSHVWIPSLFHTVHLNCQLLVSSSPKLCQFDYRGQFMHCFTLNFWYLQMYLWFFKNLWANIWRYCFCVPCSVMQHGMPQSLGWKYWAHTVLKMLVDC